AQGLDAALAVDLLDGHLRAHFLELALARPAAGQRRHESDPDILRGGRGLDEERRSDEGDRQHDDEHARETTHRVLLQRSGHRRWTQVARAMSPRAPGPRVSPPA